jgi:uncharacterized membrane protein YeaQ/YmgE (transglycosylase-associated protein family)
MNLILWIIVGGMLGGLTALYFSPGTLHGAGDIFFGLLGSLSGGYLATKLISKTPAKELRPTTYSPGGLLFATVVSILFLILFNFF